MVEPQLRVLEEVQACLLGLLGRVFEHHLEVAVLLQSAVLLRAELIPVLPDRPMVASLVAWGVRKSTRHDLVPNVRLNPNRASRALAMPRRSQ